MIEPDRKKVEKKKPRRIIRRRVPTEDLLEIDPLVLEQLTRPLPDAYSFEIPKTVQRIHKLKAAHVALQMPEGLLLYGTTIADILQQLAPTLTQVSLLGDVTYGACCVDDLAAQALGAQLLVHYGHSCLVPLQHTAVPCLYVFVEIQMDVAHFVDCLALTLQEQHDIEKIANVHLLGTVQFRHALLDAKLQMEAKLPSQIDISIPQVKPLSPGEVLGCTSPVLPETLSSRTSVVCFVADGRFHLESTMISNPDHTFYRYDPYSKTMTEEVYDHNKMKELRLEAISRAQSAQTVGIILGTLGRQGNPAILKRLKQSFQKRGKRSFIILLSEITPQKLKLLESSVDTWVQVACPRLSVDWGHFLGSKPVLSPYELFVCLEEAEWKQNYPMDYYSQAGGPWSNYFEDNKDRQCAA